MARMIQRRLRDFDFDFKGSPKRLRICSSELDYAGGGQAVPFRGEMELLERTQAYLRSMPRTLPWMLTFAAGA